MGLRSWLREYVSRRLDVPSIPMALDRLAGVGFAPNRIFDVGAHRGDFAALCAARWPGAEMACFEVLEPQLKLLYQRFGKQKSIRIFAALAGAQSRSQVDFNINDTASSVLVDSSEKTYPVRAYPMVTIDEVVAKHYGGRGPDFLKIDVQGYELEVLNGAESSLSALRVILVETNLIDIYKDVPLLAELMEWMNSRGWTPYDVCGLTRRPLDRALWQADFVFVPSASSLRANKRWM